MNGDWNDDGGMQEEKTVSIFGEKTVAENAAVPEREQESTDGVKDGRKGAPGKWVTAAVAAVVVIVGMAGIMIWKLRAGGESAPTAEETLQQETMAASEEENREDTIEAENAGSAVEGEEAKDSEPAVGDMEDVGTESAAGGTEDGASAENAAEKKAKKLYDLLAEYDALRVEDGHDNYMEIIPEGPVSEINWLMRRYNAGEDIAEVSLEWERFEQAAIYYMDQLQREGSLEYTYPAGVTEDGDDIVLYVNTERSIYYIGTAPSGSSGMGLYHGTVYYDVKVDDVTGLIDFCVYDGLLADGKPSDVGEMIHVVDEIDDHDGRLESATNAYCVDQNGNAITFYDIYNNEGGRWAEESFGEYEDDLVPEWEFGEY